MKLEEVEKKFNSHPSIEYFIHGIVVEDGEYKLDAIGCVSRKDAREESKKFVKYNLYTLSKDLNQNL